MKRSRTLLSSYIKVDSILQSITSFPEFQPLYDPPLTHSFERLLHSLDLFALRHVPLSKYLLCFRKEAPPGPVTQRTLARYYAPIGPLGGLQDTEELLRRASPSPFGLGTATVVDPGVRSAREVKAADFVVLSAETLQEVPLGDFGASLCWSLDQRCRFTPKKINIYSPGDFFSIHKDTPRSKTHIGTLVIVLQHPEEGGEFVVYDNFGKEQIVQTNQDMNSVVIYTDIDHEVRKVLSGLRITLTVDIEWDGQSEEEGESGTFGEDRLRCPRTITMVRRKSVESGDGKLVRERVEEICGGVLRAVGESEEFGVMLYHEYVKGVKEKCLKGIDKELFWYFKKKGWEVRLCPVIILKTDVSGDWKHEISFSFYQLPSIFVNPDESFSLEKFKESKEKERMEKMEMKQKERMERKARRGLEGEDEEEEEEEDERTPLVVFTQPQMKLVKHVEGAEYTGNEGMDEEYFYYITAITVRLPSAMSSLEDSDESSPSPCPPPQDDKPSQLQDSDKPSPSPIPPQDDQPSQ